MLQDDLMKNISLSLIDFMCFMVLPIPPNPLGQLSSAGLGWCGGSPQGT